MNVDSNQNHQPNKNQNQKSTDQVSQANQSQPEKNQSTPPSPAVNLKGAGQAFAPKKPNQPNPNQSTGKNSENNNQNKSNKPKKKFKRNARAGKNKKVLLAVIALLVIVVGSAAAILITRRQQEQETVAPTAPESKPAASSQESCTMLFSVPGPTSTPSPSPTSSPQCPEPATIEFTKLNEQTVKIVASANQSYTNIQLRLILKSNPNNEITLAAPDIIEATTWTWSSVDYAYSEIEAARFYINAGGSAPGELCGEGVPVPIQQSCTPQEAEQTEFNITPVRIQEDEDTRIEVTAVEAFTNIALRITDNNGQVHELQNPSSINQGPPTTWTWNRVGFAYDEIALVEFYVNVTQDNPQGEICGQDSISITPTVTPTPTATPTPTSTPTPTPTPEPGACGDTPCTGDADCDGQLVCVEADDGNSYCSMADYQDACIADPSVTTCCTAPTDSPTQTPTDEPTTEPQSTDEPGPTNPPYSTPLPTEPGQQQTYIVDTEAACNESCSVNADCTNISHICYNGRCRLDVNPENEYCQLPSGETQVTRQAGIGVIGAGLLMLLLL